MPVEACCRRLLTPHRAFAAGRCERMLITGKSTSTRLISLPASEEDAAARRGPQQIRKIILIANASGGSACSTAIRNSASVRVRGISPGRTRNVPVEGPPRSQSTCGGRGAKIHLRCLKRETTMEDENIALNSVLGLELNRVFFAVRETANKQKIIEFAREVLEDERANLPENALPEGPG